MSLSVFRLACLLWWKTFNIMESFDTIYLKF